MQTKRTLKSIIRAICSELKDDEKTFYLKKAYSISVNSNEQAYTIGIWHKWMLDADFEELNAIRQELKYLKDYFVKANLEDYYFLKKKINFSHNYWFEIFVILLGSLWSAAGVYQQLSGLVIIGKSIRTQLPVVNNGLFSIIIGTSFVITGISSLLYKLNKYKYYKKFDYIIQDIFPDK